MVLATTTEVREGIEAWRGELDESDGYDGPEERHGR